MKIEVLINSINHKDQQLIIQDSNIKLLKGLIGENMGHNITNSPGASIGDNNKSEVHINSHNISKDDCKNLEEEIPLLIQALKESDDDTELEETILEKALSHAKESATEKLLEVLKKLSASTIQAAENLAPKLIPTLLSLL